MKKKLLLGMASVVLFSLAAKPAFAETVKGPTDEQGVSENDGKKLDSEGRLKLIAPGSLEPGIEPPEQPLDPEEGELVPEGPGGTVPGGKVGPLYLNYVPNLDFGTWEIGGETEFYAAPQIWKDSNSEENRLRANFAQVTDLRGTESGWSLSVSQDEKGFTSTEGTSERTLEGTTINFMYGAVGSDMLEVENGAVVPSPKDAKSLIPEEGGILTPGSSVKIMSADEGAGAGTWSLNFEKELKNHMEKMEEGPVNQDTEEKYPDRATTGAVKLTIPKKANKYAATYATTLTWNLEEVPSSVIL